MLVEFALVAPLLFLLIFGVIEFGYAFLQYLDVRHGAREAGRLAAVNYRPDASLSVDQSSDIIQEACDRMDSGDDVSIQLAFDDPAENVIGDKVIVTVRQSYSSLTGFFDILNVDFTSAVDVRLEQDATWADATEDCAP